MDSEADGTRILVDPSVTISASEPNRCNSSLGWRVAYMGMVPRAGEGGRIASGLISPSKRPRAGRPLVEPSIRIQNDFTTGSIMVNTGG